MALFLKITLAGMALGNQEYKQRIIWQVTCPRQEKLRLEFVVEGM